MNRRRGGHFVLGALVALIFVAPALEAQKYGGVLQGTLKTSPPSQIIYEGASNDYTLPMSPIYSNLAIFNPSEQIERLDTIIPELATKWELNGDRTKMTFTLRRGVKWHDGKPMTSRDVKDTFDIVRGVHASKRLRLNVRKAWFANVKDVTTQGDYEVTFHLGRPQASLLVMLASNLSPIMAAHGQINKLRLEAMGTGPFRLQEHVRDKSLILVKNKDYFVKGRPYLDGIHYTIIRSRGSRIAALQAGQVDMVYPVSTPQKVYERLKNAKAGIKFHRSSTNSNFNVIMNIQKPPFDNLKLRQAVNLALNRKEFVKVTFQGAGIVGGAMLPPPYGTFGLPADDLARQPGYGTPEENQKKARALVAELGHSPSNPLKVVMHVRATNSYLQMAAWTLDQLKKIGIELSLKNIQTSQWYPMVARREYNMLLNATGLGIDEPDANLAENFSCGSMRNYSDYCNKEMEKLYEEQSMEGDTAKRAALVQAIDRRLQHEVARPVLGWRIDYNAYSGVVKNFFYHNSLYNVYRMQDVWLER